MNTDPDFQMVPFNTADQARSSEPLLLRVSDVARLLSVGRTKVYELINRDELDVVRIDGCVRVSRASVDRLIKERQAHHIGE